MRERKTSHYLIFKIIKKNMRSIGNKKIRIKHDRFLFSTNWIKQIVNKYVALILVYSIADFISNR